MNKFAWLDEFDKKRAWMCVRNIEDKLQAIKRELEKELSYKSYINEKMDSVCWDAECIRNMCDLTTEFMEVDDE